VLPGIGRFLRAAGLPGALETLFCLVVLVQPVMGHRQKGPVVDPGAVLAGDPLLQPLDGVLEAIGAVQDQAPGANIDMTDRGEVSPIDGSAGRSAGITTDSEGTAHGHGEILTSIIPNGGHLSKRETPANTCREGEISLTPAEAGAKIPGSDWATESGTED
jgi:hypothetical protein